MIVFDSLDKIQDMPETAVALGNFDGVHVGHRAIITAAVEKAKVRGLKSCVFTFSSHPKNLIPGAKPVKNIIYREEKAALIEQMGVDYLVDIPFTEAIMTMEPETFVKNLLVDAIRAKELFCGFNYHFGYRGKGDVQELRILGSRYGFHVNAMPAVTVDGDVVSSTLIRGLIMAGEMDECSKFLGRNYDIGGEVVVGNRLGKRIGFEVFTTEIHRHATVAPIDFGSSATLSSVLVGICLCMWMLQNYITTRKSYNLVSGKGARRVEQSMGKGATVAAWAYIVLVLLIAVGVPYFSVISTSLINLRGYGLAPGNFTIAHYVELFTENEKGLSALKNSVFLAVTSATICAVLGTLLVLAVRKSHSKLRKVVEAIGLLPEMLPGIVLVIGIMLFWNQIYNILPLYNTMGIMVLAYVVLFLPYTVQYVTSSFTQISDSLMAAGQVFGGSPVYILRRITLPLIRQGIATGWMMTFIIAFRELVTASLIAPPNTLVVSTFIVREFEQGSVSVGMAMAVLCVLFSTTALLILNTVIDHRKVH